MSRAFATYVLFALGAVSGGCKSKDNKAPESGSGSSPTSAAPSAGSSQASAAPKDCASACSALRDCNIANGWIMGGVSLAAGNNCDQVCDKGFGATPTEGVEFLACLKSASGCSAISECWNAHDAKAKAAAAAAPPPAPPAPAVAVLEVGKTVSRTWDEQTPREVTWTPAPGTTIRFSVVPGKNGEEQEVRASVGGKEQLVTKFSINPARGGVLAWHLLADGGLLVMGTSSAASQDEGSASVDRLTWDAAKGKVVSAKTWSGSDLDKLPAWAKALKP